MIEDDEQINSFDKILNTRWITHTLFWVVLFSISVAQQSIVQRRIDIAFFSMLALLPSQMIGAYFLTYYLTPRFLYRRKYLACFLLFLTSTFLLGILARILTVYGAEPMYIDNPTQETILEILTDPFYVLFIYVPGIQLYPLLMAAVKIIKDRYSELGRVESLRREKTQAELNFLKAQVHPHFLLNTLNNLYALTLKKSDKAPETVIKLSDMLVYTLYKCNEKYVGLDSEIKLLRDYIALEKLRYGENLSLSFNQKVEDGTVRIAPLILLSLVENAFKHGVSGEVNKATIDIDLLQSGDFFTFEIQNSKNNRKQIDETDYTKGIGVSNVKKQLDLIYPGSHEFETKETENSYHAFLRLDLAGNEN